MGGLGAWRHGVVLGGCRRGVDGHGRLRRRGNRCRGLGLLDKAAADDGLSCWLFGLTGWGGCGWAGRRGRLGGGLGGQCCRLGCRVGWGWCQSGWVRQRNWKGVGGRWWWSAVAGGLGACDGALE